MAKNEIGTVVEVDLTPADARMVRLEAASFLKSVGGSWALTDIAQELRGMAYCAERDEARTRVEVWRTDKPERRVVVPMGNVGWYVDAVVDEPKKGAK